jgi:RHS repeat-associated protein
LHVDGSTTAALPTGTDAQAFCYDEQNRLQWASSQSGSVPCGGSLNAGTLTSAQYTATYAYDLLDRLHITPTGTYSYGDSRHLDAVTAIGSSYTAAYDGAGNMTCRAPTSSATCAGTPTGAKLTYDNEGRLSAWQNAQTNPTSNTTDLYDGEGNRVQQFTANGATTTTITYVSNLEELSTSAGITSTTTYYSLGGKRVAEAVNGLFSYVGNDSLGSAEVALDASGTAQASTLYGPFGNTRYSNGTMPGSFGFTGQRADSATGLDYYGARYYDPVAGQFASADSADAGGLNRYAYVSGNPETLTDPTGHCPWCIGFVIGAVVGAAVEYGSQVYTNYQNHDPNPWTHVNGTQILEAGLVGGVIGATGGLAGAAVATALEGSGAVVAIGGAAAAGAVLGAGEGAAGQIGNNLIHGKTWSDDVGSAAIFGAVTGGVAGGAGAAVSRYGGRFVRAVGSLLSNEGGGCSFSPDTPVATPSGEQPIGSLTVGDQVTAYDPATGKPSTQAVQHVWINHDDDLVDLTLQTQVATQASSGQDAVTYHPQDENIHTNARHPFLTKERGWVTVKQLTLGMHVLREDGTTALVVGKQVVPGAADMWNLTVGNLHTYAVGNGQYVVHNTDPACLIEAAQRARVGGGHAAGAAANIADDSGNLLTETSGQALDPIEEVGSTHGTGRCAECRLLTRIAQMAGRNGLDGATIDVGVSQVLGKPPCSDCQATFAQAARYTGGTFRVWFNATKRRLIGSIGGPMIFGPR